MSITATEIGTTTVGGSWLNLASGTMWVQPHTVTAGLLSEIRVHVRQDVANVPRIAAFLFPDHATLTRPGPCMGISPLGGNDWIATAAGRWVSFPFGTWFASSTDVWLGIILVGANSMDIAYETTGGDAGTYGLNDSAGFTATTNDISMYAVVLS